VEDTLFKLNIDEVTVPLKVEETYYIFRLNNIISSRQQTLAEAQGAIRNFLGNEKMQKELGKWLDEIKKQTYIKIL
jgi:parvulin-like peptidyl-prolyl isomerase